MTHRTCAAGTLLAALTLGGCATTNNPPPSTAQGPSWCLTSTGSAFPDPVSHCTAYGRSYSRSNLDQTGATTNADALRTLDPSITVTH
jgi:hypothetical protein